MESIHDTTGWRARVGNDPTFTVEEQALIQALVSALTRELLAEATARSAA